jgi:hypothetical protein
VHLGVEASAALKSGEETIRDDTLVASPLANGRRFAADEPGDEIGIPLAAPHDLAESERVGVHRQLM